MSGQDRIASHGRGGAGNLAREDPTAAAPQDLSTPTLKAEHYTTGRGGSGNMAKNDLSHPEIARASQDVEGSQPREPDGPQHYGRGGAANFIKPTEGPAQGASDKTQRNSDEAKREQAAEKSFVEKGMDFIAKLGKK